MGDARLDRLFIYSIYAVGNGLCSLFTLVWNVFASYFRSYRDGLLMKNTIVCTDEKQISKRITKNN